MDCDVLICGAGPAGSVAATLVARAGLRVRLLDRARFPRPKLCGDTLNPGALAHLRRLHLDDDLERISLAVDGMVVTGGRGVRVEGRYPSGVRGLALTRRELDMRLLDRALAAGVMFDDGVTIRSPIVAAGRVEGVRVDARGREVELRARLTIAADGRHSSVAFALGLARHPARPRRWAIGTYYEGVAGLTRCGEMHIRGGHYLGIAPLPNSVANVCLVVEGRDARLRIDPLRAIAETIECDPMLRDRFDAARPVAPAVVLGPLAVETNAAGMPGLLLAGDAAGFVDPMTGDGLRFAIAGAELAATAAIDAIVNGAADPERTLAAARARAFGGKYRFNRALRSIVASPAAVRAATIGASVAPFAIAGLVHVAGDVPRRGRSARR